MSYTKIAEAIKISVGYPIIVARIILFYCIINSGVLPSHQPIRALNVHHSFFQCVVDLDSIASSPLSETRKRACTRNVITLHLLRDSAVIGPDTRHNWKPAYQG